MAYRYRMTFTRPDADTEWPFWESSLNSTSFQTKANAWQDWYAGRSDSSLSTSTSADGNTIHIDLMFANEEAWNTFRSEAESASLDNQWADSNVTSWMTTNNVSLSESSGEV